MKVSSYGLFWRASEIAWRPGAGTRNEFRLYGRIGSNRGNIRIADFRHQQGIYILFDEYGVSYVGLTRSQGLGKRLKDHMSDHLAGTWNRFSWFGFRPVSPSPGAGGLIPLGEPGTDVSEDTDTTIGDLEALLIRAIGPKHNVARMNFRDAEQWTQIDYDDVDLYKERLRPKVAGVAGT